MNHGGVQSSPVQQMVAAGSPTWWSINNIRPPLHHHHHPFSAAPPPHHHHHHDHHQFAPPSSSSSWNHDDDFGLHADSWSQLLLGGLVGEDEHIQVKKMENWEQQFLNNNNNQNIPNNAIKQENNVMNNYRSLGNNIQVFQGAKPSNNNNNCSSWSHIHHQQMNISASSSKSCITTANNLLDFSPPSECNSTATTGGAAAKKARITQPAASSAHSTIKVRKEKLGDRVTALHQLVSPFGKTDTASVLLEAIGYIKFLQNQIEALSQPYLGSGSSRNLVSQQHPPVVQGERNCLFPEDPGQLLNENCIKRKEISDLECNDEEPKQDLKSRGLCLVPISCTIDVGSEINGADYWASAFGAANFR
ncbi:hypothetical protein ABFX02_11G050000 [Erythranthe guttata]